METNEFIESYFQHQLSETEKKDFEAKCETDASFADEVASYILLRAQFKQMLLEQKQSDWKTEQVNKKEDLFFIKPFKRISDHKWRYAAAAMILLAFGTYFFEKQSSPQRFADHFVKNNFKELSLTMDGSKDSMQMALSAFNNQHYDSAQIIFTSLYQADNENSDALKDAGITYLMQKNYDDALEKFDALSAKKNLFSNPGTFYRAITLLERNKSDDKEAAKKLLQKVVSENLEGSKDASELLKKF